MKDDAKFVEFLKEQGFKTSDIIYMVSLRNQGLAMTKAIYKFNELYDNKKIDGFPESSIQVLEMFYGKKLKKMKPETIEEKVASLQKCLDANPDYDEIKRSVNYYLS